MLAFPLSEGEGLSGANDQTFASGMPMAPATDLIGAHAFQSPQRDLRDRSRDWIPRVVVALSFALVLVFVYVRRARPEVAIDFAALRLGP